MADRLNFTIVWDNVVNPPVESGKSQSSTSSSIDRNQLSALLGMVKESHMKIDRVNQYLRGLKVGQPNISSRVANASISTGISTALASTTKPQTVPATKDLVKPLAAELRNTIQSTIRSELNKQIGDIKKTLTPVSNKPINIVNESRVKGNIVIDRQGSSIPVSRQPAPQPAARPNATVVVQQPQRTTTVSASSNVIPVDFNRRQQVEQARAAQLMRASAGGYFRPDLLLTIAKAPYDLMNKAVSSIRSKSSAASTSSVNSLVSTLSSFFDTKPTMPVRQQLSRGYSIGGTASRDIDQLNRRARDAMRKEAAANEVAWRNQIAGLGYAWNAPHTYSRYRNVAPPTGIGRGADGILSALASGPVPTTSITSRNQVGANIFSRITNYAKSAWGRLMREDQGSTRIFSDIANLIPGTRPAKDIPTAANLKELRNLVGQDYTGLAKIGGHLRRIVEGRRPAVDSDAGVVSAIADLAEKRGVQLPPHLQSEIQKARSILASNASREARSRTGGGTAATTVIPTQVNAGAAQSGGGRLPPPTSPPPSTPPSSAGGSGGGGGGGDGYRGRVNAPNVLADRPNREIGWRDSSGMLHRDVTLGPTQATMQKGTRGGDLFTRMFSVQEYTVASMMLGGVIGAVRTFNRSILDVNKQMAELQKVMVTSSSNLEGLKSSAASTAKETGLTINEVLKGYQIFAQQGLSPDDVKTLGNITARAASISEFDTAEMSEVFTAGTRIFGKDFGTTDINKQSQGLIDSFLAVEQANAVTERDLGNVMKRVGVAASSAGMSIHELNAVTTVIKERTRQPGEQISTALRMILRQMYTKTGQEALSKIGVDVIDKGTGQARGAFQILQDTSRALKDVSSLRQRDVAASIGQTRFSNTFLALMQGMEKAPSVVETSMNAQGTADQRLAIVGQTLAKQWEKTIAAYQEAAITVGDSFVRPLSESLEMVQKMVGLFTSIAKIEFPFSKTIKETLGVAPTEAKGSTVGGAVGTAAMGALAFGLFGNTKGLLKYLGLTANLFTGGIFESPASAEARRLRELNLQDPRRQLLESVGTRRMGMATIPGAVNQIISGKLLGAGRVDRGSLAEMLRAGGFTARLANLAYSPKAIEEGQRLLDVSKLSKLMFGEVKTGVVNQLYGSNLSNQAIQKELTLATKLYTHQLKRNQIPESSNPMINWGRVQPRFAARLSPFLASMVGGVSSGLTYEATIGEALRTAKQVDIKPSTVSGQMDLPFTNLANATKSAAETIKSTAAPLRESTGIFSRFTAGMRSIASVVTRRAVSPGTEGTQVPATTTIGGRIGGRLGDFAGGVLGSLAFGAAIQGVSFLISRSTRSAEEKAQDTGLNERIRRANETIKLGENLSSLASDFDTLDKTIIDVNKRFPSENEQLSAKRRGQITSTAYELQAQRQERIRSVNQVILNSPETYLDNVRGLTIADTGEVRFGGKKLEDLPNQQIKDLTSKLLDSQEIEASSTQLQKQISVSMENAYKESAPTLIANYVGAVNAPFVPSLDKERQERDRRVLGIEGSTGAARMSAFESAVSNMATLLNKGGSLEQAQQAIAGGLGYRDTRRAYELMTGRKVRSAAEEALDQFSPGPLATAVKPFVRFGQFAGEKIDELTDNYFTQELGWGREGRLALADKMVGQLAERYKQSTLGKNIYEVIDSEERRNRLAAEMRAGTTRSDVIYQGSTKTGLDFTMVPILDRQGRVVSYREYTGGYNKETKDFEGTTAILTPEKAADIMLARSKVGTMRSFAGVAVTPEDVDLTEKQMFYSGIAARRLNTDQWATGPSRLSQLSSQMAGLFTGFDKNNAPMFNKSLQNVFLAAKKMEETIKTGEVAMGSVDEEGQGAEARSGQTREQNAAIFEKQALTIEGLSVLERAVSFFGDVVKSFDSSIEKFSRYTSDRAAKALMPGYGPLSQFGGEAPGVKFPKSWQELSGYERAAATNPKLFMRLEAQQLSLGMLTESYATADNALKQLDEILTTSDPDALAGFNKKELADMLYNAAPEKYGSVDSAFGHLEQLLDPTRGAAIGRDQQIKEIQELLREPLIRSREQTRSAIENMSPEYLAALQEGQAATALGDLQRSAEQAARGLTQMESAVGRFSNLSFAKGEGSLGRIGSRAPIIFSQAKGDQMGQLLDFSNYSEFGQRREVLRLLSSREYVSGRRQLSGPEGTIMPALTREQYRYQSRLVDIEERKAREARREDRNRALLGSYEQSANSAIMQLDTLLTSGVPFSRQQRGGIEALKGQIEGISSLPERAFIGRTGRLNTNPFQVLKTLPESLGKLFTSGDLKSSQQEKEYKKFVASQPEMFRNLLSGGQLSGKAAELARSELNKQEPVVRKLDEVKQAIKSQTAAITGGKGSKDVGAGGSGSSGGGGGDESTSKSYRRSIGATGAGSIGGGTTALDVNISKVDGQTIGNDSMLVGTRMFSGGSGSSEALATLFGVEKGQVDLNNVARFGGPIVAGMNRPYTNEEWAERSKKFYSDLESGRLPQQGGVPNFNKDKLIANFQAAEEANKKWQANYRVYSDRRGRGVREGIEATSQVANAVTSGGASQLITNENLQEFLDRSSKKLVKEGFIENGIMSTLLTPDTDRLLPSRKDITTVSTPTNVGSGMPPVSMLSLDGIPGGRIIEKSPLQMVPISQLPAPNINEVQRDPLEGSVFGLSALKKQRMSEIGAVEPAGEFLEAAILLGGSGLTRAGIKAFSRPAAAPNTYGGLIDEQMAGFLERSGGGTPFTMRELRDNYGVFQRRSRMLGGINKPEYIPPDEFMRRQALAAKRQLFADKELQYTALGEARQGGMSTLGNDAATMFRDFDVTASERAALYKQYRNSTAAAGTGAGVGMSTFGYMNTVPPVSLNWMDDSRFNNVAPNLGRDLESLNNRLADNSSNISNISDEKKAEMFANKTATTLSEQTTIKVDVSDAAKTINQEVKSAFDAGSRTLTESFSTAAQEGSKAISTGFISACTEGSTTIKNSVVEGSSSAGQTLKSSIESSRVQVDVKTSSDGSKGTGAMESKIEDLINVVTGKYNELQSQVSEVTDSLQTKVKEVEDKAIAASESASQVVGKVESIQSDAFNRITSLEGLVTNTNQGVERNMTMIQEVDRKHEINYTKAIEEVGAVRSYTDDQVNLTKETVNKRVGVVEKLMCDTSDNVEYVANQCIALQAAVEGGRTK